MFEDEATGECLVYDILVYSIYLNQRLHDATHDTSILPRYNMKAWLNLAISHKVHPYYGRSSDRKQLYDLPLLFSTL